MDSIIYNFRKYHFILLWQVYDVNLLGICVNIRLNSRAYVVNRSQILKIHFIMQDTINYDSEINHILL